MSMPWLSNSRACFDGQSSALASRCVVPKPLKNKVMSKERNQLGVGRAEVLLRAGMNLRLLNKHKSMMQEMGLLVQ